MWTAEQRKAIIEFEDAAEKAGGYVAWPPNGRAEHDYRKMIKYCQEKGIDCMDLTDEELQLFELPLARA
jgi:hypothetical protein